ncbi:MAG: PilW family protein [Sideroxydans sp.]|nr:PilW family protein [Sideroxydans sp.]
MTLNKHKVRTPQTGFTLIEIMVGLAIGMLATLIIIQVLSVFETQKRTTTGTADAQTNGNIALYNISRELMLAGYPLVAGMSPANNMVLDSPLECTTLGFANSVSALTSIDPVTITDDSLIAGASDIITLHYGNSLRGGVPTTIIATGADIPVNSNFGCQAGDIILITNGTACAMTSASSVAIANTVSIADDPTTDAALNGIVVPKANLSCLGSKWDEITFSISNPTNKDASLNRSDTSNVAGTAIVAGIVNIQAQYGISDKQSSNQITQWVDATGSWAAPSIQDRNRIKAIRIAIVARNQKLELSDVTEPCSSLTAQAPTGLCAWEGNAASPAPAIDLSADAKWQKYRYRVFETIIPLRNVIWSRNAL